MMALLKFPIGWYQLNILFLAPPQEFWCAKPAAFSRFTVKEWREMCAPVSKFAILLEQAQGALLTMEHIAKTYFMLIVVLIVLTHLLPLLFSNLPLLPAYLYLLARLTQSRVTQFIGNSRTAGPIFSYDFIGIVKNFRFVIIGSRMIGKLMIKNKRETFLHTKYPFRAYQTFNVKLNSFLKLNS